MKCIVCTNQPMQPFFAKKTFRIVRCAHCRLMAVENVPEDLSPFYASGYFTGDPGLDGYMDYDSDKEVSRRTYENYFSVLDQHLTTSRPITMLEVGCATGFFMELAKTYGWQTVGIDLSQYAVQKAKEKGLVVTVDTLESFNSTQQFDIIVMQDVIEHVKDPVATLRKANQLLALGGLLVITTPDAGSMWARAWGKKWHAFVPPQHLFYFSQKNLGKLLNHLSFDVVDTSHHGKYFAVPYILRLLYSWTGVKIFSKLAEWSARSIFKKLSFPINVGDTLFLVAKKR